MDLIGLPNVKTVECKKMGRFYVVEAVYDAPPCVCPKCGGSDHYGHDYREADYTDTQLHGLPCLIHMRRQRMRCRTCGKAFLTKIPEFDDDFRMTVRCAEWIEAQSTERTFTSVSEDLRIDESVVRDVFRRYSEEEIKRLEIKAGRVIGIDEVFINDDHRCIFTNIADRTVIDLLKGRKKEMVDDYLRQLEGVRGVEVVCIDMWRPYRDAAAEVMPAVPVVVDKFHLLKETTKCMNEIRLHYQRQMGGHANAVFRNRYLFRSRLDNLSDDQMGKLDDWKTVCPEIYDAYMVKEQLFDIYKCPTREEAKKAFEAWVKSLPQTVHKAFRPAISTIRNWEKEVFNYFDHPFTNAYTECMNGILKIANRSGRGYSFDVARFKLLFGYNAPRVHCSTTRSLMTLLRRWNLTVSTDGFVTSPVPG